VLVVVAHHISFSCDDRRFRWAFCQLETLRRTPLQKVPLALKALPKGLNETYERTLQSLDEEKWEYTHRIFQFLTVAARPLYIQEVAEVFSIQINEEVTGIPEFNARWREKDPEFAVLSACSSLVAVVPASGGLGQIVQFSHFSVQEFLTSNRLRDHQGSPPTPPLSQYHVLSELAHTFFTRACLSVLLQLNFRIHKNSIKRMFPLATYAAEYLVRHAQCGQVSSLIENGMDRLFEDKSRFAAWIWVYNIDNPAGPHMDGNTPRNPEKSPLYYASLCGFVDIVKLLVASHPEDIRTRSRDGATPLHAAFRNGHLGVAQLLLQHEADPNARDNKDDTPLHIASRRGDKRAVEFVIAAGAKVNHEISHELTALHVAAEHGHDSVVDLLLNLGAKVDAEDRNGRTPLHVAADHGKARVARLLLQRHAKVNAREVEQQTPLHIASSGGQLEAVRALLDSDADVDARDGEGWTALHLTAFNGHLKVAELLLGRGATWDIENNDGDTPLDVASNQDELKRIKNKIHNSSSIKG
jgi:ankyrin repeat protein